MGFPANLIQFYDPFSTPDTSTDRGTEFNYDNDPRASRVTKEHPFVNTIREVIRKYRMQSPAHFGVEIGVKQTAQVDASLADATPASFRIKVTLSVFTGSTTVTCRPDFCKHRRNRIGKPTNNIQVLENSRWLLLDDFLRANYPVLDTTVSLNIMQAWWAENGKTFNWTGLPTELKEQVIHFCLHQPFENSNYYQRRSLRGYRTGLQARVGLDRELGVYEIVDQLGDWAAVLRVSHQMRAIALRLCFVGSSELLFGKGFCISASSYHSLDKTMRRLGRYYQMMAPNSLPVDDKTRALADCYKQYPNIYPHLNQYATFRHGLRKVCIKLDFVSYMHFFRVTVGGFQHYWTPDYITYEVFEQLPHLTNIDIRLPLQPHEGWKNNPSQHCPKLFDDYQPCPRTLHRVIYERIAEVLAPYKYVRLMNFGDDYEKARFLSLRKDAVAKLKWTKAEYQELYAECGGGIELEDCVEPGSSLYSTRSKASANEEAVYEDDGFFPPRCRCDRRCNQVYQRKERRQRRR